jgi:hypothetical protein
MLSRLNMKAPLKSGGGPVQKLVAFPTKRDQVGLCIVTKAAAPSMSGHTVAKIISAEDLQSFFKETRQKLFEIAPDALASFHAQVKIDGRLAYSFLKDLGISPSREAMAQFMEAANPQTETGEERQARMVACVLLESHKNVGVDLPKEVEEALAKDAWECAEETAKTSGAKLSRR